MILYGQTAAAAWERNAFSSEAPSTVTKIFLQLRCKRRPFLNPFPFTLPSPFTMADNEDELVDYDEEEVRQISQTAAIDMDPISTRLHYYGSSQLLRKNVP
jgi:hypothetical protein